MSALDTKLHQLMWTGRQYRLDELHRLSGADRTMTRKSFRNRMAERKAIYKIEDGKYRCVAVVLPAPCEVKRKIKRWIKNVITR